MANGNNRIDPIPKDERMTEGKNQSQRTFNTADVLSGVASGFGILANMEAAEQRAEDALFASEQQAEELELQSEVEQFRGKQRIRQINERVNKTLADQTAALAASGIDVGSGLARKETQQTLQQATDVRQSIRNNLVMQQLQRQGQIEQTRTIGKQRAESLESRGKARALAGFGRLFGRFARKEDRRNQLLEKTRTPEGES